MKKFLVPLLVMSLCACTVGALPGPQPPVREKPPLAIPAVPVGKDWQVIEKAPDLRDERDRLPFQTEQSIQPEGTHPSTPAERQKIETQH